MSVVVVETGGTVEVVAVTGDAVELVDVGNVGGPPGATGPTGPAGPPGMPGAPGNWATAQTVEYSSATTYTVVAADAGKLKWIAANVTVTLPSGGPLQGQRVDFTCDIATFVLGAGATWAVPPTPSAVTRAAGSFATAIKMTATSWALTGDLA